MAQANAGRFRHRASIYTWSASVDAGGGDAGSWGDSGNSAWGLLRPLRGSEIDRANSTEAQRMHVFEMRYNTNVTPSVRLVIGSSNYEVVSVLDRDTQHRRQDVLVREVV